MEVQAVLADSVAAAEGKLYIQGGGWNVVFAQAFPTRHPRIGLGILIRVPYHATNQNHRFEVRLEDTDGTVVPIGDAPPGETTDGKLYRVEGDFNMGRPPHLSAGDEQIIPIAANLDGLIFEGPGAFRFVIDIDGSEVAVLPFRVTHMPPGLRMAG